MREVEVVRRKVKCREEIWTPIMEIVVSLRFTTTTTTIQIYFLLFIFRCDEVMQETQRNKQQK